MDPATISLILLGTRLAIQAYQGHGRSKRALSDLEQILAEAHAEGRTLTLSEVLSDGAALDEAITDYHDAVTELQRTIDERG